jgi:radical SAM protein with 4Fe4S-binding SPASM domain
VNKSEKFTKKSAMYIGSPYLMQVHLLNSCINDCDYCYIKSPSTQILNPQRLIKFFQKFEEYNNKYNLEIAVSLTGGDLFLYPYLELVVEYLKRAKNVSSVSLLINSLWHKNSKKIVLKISNKLENVQLNIDNIKDREEDLKWLVRKKIPVNIKILLSKDLNYYNSQKNILKKLTKSNPKLYISVDRLIPTTRKQLKNICSLKELEEKINEILVLSKGKFVSDDPIVKLLLSKKEKLLKDSMYGCSIGKGSVTVYPDGSIKLCPRIPKFNTGFTVENFDLKKYLRFSEKLTERIHVKCKGCNKYQLCKGGCPASSFIKNNTLDKDINCYNGG